MLLTRRGFFERLAACGACGAGAVVAAPLIVSTAPSIANPFSCSPPLQPGDTITISGCDARYIVTSSVAVPTTVSWPRDVPGPGGCFTWTVCG
jgi:hypothetical protein